MERGRAGGVLSRRQFVQGLGIAGLGLLVGCGRLPQQAPSQPQLQALARVGWLSSYTRDLPSMSRSFGVFQQALADHGWVEGHNLLIEARFADDQEERLPALATELAGLPVDVLVATGTQATLAASQASATLPIIFTTGGTPIAYGLA